MVTADVWYVAQVEQATGIANQAEGQGGHKSMELRFKQQVSAGKQSGQEASLDKNPKSQ